MTELEFEAVIQLAVSILKDLAPKRTGNLAYNAIRIERTAPNEFRIYVSVEGEHTSGALDGIAPYQVYVNDYPTVGRSGKKNKNYHWWEAALELAAEQTAQFVQGELKE